MAETFLRPVIEKLIELLIQEAKSLKGVHGQVKSLKDELEIIQPFLRGAEAKWARGALSDATRIWLNQLRDEADRIEDVVDLYTYRLQHQRTQSGFLGSLSQGGHWVKSLTSNHEISSEIQDIEESLRKIKERGTSYGLRPFEQGSSSTSTVVEPRIGSLFVDDTELVGIDSMSKELVGCLVEDDSKRMVISLVGEGGIGKTTLARKVYKDAVEKGCFDHHVWVTVSQSYDIDKILNKLLTHVCPTSRESVDVEEALTLLRDSLQEKRYVIAFDDVWQTDFWSAIGHAFPSNGNGSRILVTTRKSTVVDSFRTISCNMIVKELTAWSTDQAWELFCKKAFSYSEIESCCPSELEQLSREILSKCQGLPLAVVAIAGLLSKKEKSIVEWQTVFSNLSQEFEENRELSSVSRILLLSYLDLPFHLKSCFMFFGVFPEDSPLDGDYLCRVWIAEGLIQSKDDDKLEKIAEQYLIELISRNLVSCEMKYGMERKCTVHDLIHEMILRINKDVNFCQQFHEQKSSFNEKSRRWGIFNTTKNVVNISLGSNIRSIFLDSIEELADSFVADILKYCILLKVLDFESTPLDNLPKQVGNLLHLRYLSLRGTKVKMLPKSIGKLCNLQTLDVQNTLVRELPVEINKLRKLRHIFAGVADKESKYTKLRHIGVRIHEGFGKLEDLQTLYRIEANPGKVGFVKELQMLRKLQFLGISKVTTETVKALEQVLEKMNHLEDLHMSSINEEEVLDLNLICSPPPMLQYLKLSCRVEKFPSWISELGNLVGLELNFSRMIVEPLKSLKGLPNLAYFRLYQAYDGKELHFEEGGFPKLKQLELKKLEGLEALKIDKAAMPLLEKLSIGPLPLVKEMPSDIQRLTNLKSLKVFDMPREFVSALQPEGGSEYWKIQHVPNVTFKYYTGRGFNQYKIGSSELWKRLQEHQ